MDDSTRLPEAKEMNLTAHRGARTVWEREDRACQRRLMTRALVGIGGGALALQALRLPTWRGRMLFGLGSSMAWWAATGEGDLSDVRRWFNSVLERAPWKQADSVDEASDESFPASDAPARTPTLGTGLRRDTSVH